MPVTTTDATTFDELLAEGDAVPVEGWDFSWFAGRATEERPSWGYAALIGDRMATASAALDIQTGGGEVTAGIPRPPAFCAPPNPGRRTSRSPGGTCARSAASVVEVADDAPLPFADESFDLVVSRHPVVQWDEIARVLRPGGTYLAQLIGDRTNRELSEYFLGPLDAQVAERGDRDPRPARGGRPAADRRTARGPAAGVLRRGRGRGVSAQGDLDRARTSPSTGSGTGWRPCTTRSRRRAVRLVRPPGARRRPQTGCRRLALGPDGSREQVEDAGDRRSNGSGSPAARAST